MANHRFMLASGRGLGISAVGDPISKRLVVLCHPTPGAGLFDPDPLVTQSAGVHVLMVDRPGYGASDPLDAADSPSVQGRADDLAEFLRRSETVARAVNGADFGTVGAVGWGAGGAVALSLAARYPDLVDRVAVVGLPGPKGAGLSARSRQGFGLSALDAHSPRSRLTQILGARGALTVSSLGIDDDDPALSRPGLRGRIERMLAEASVQGAAGLATDLTAFRDRTWAEELGRITASTLLVYGSRDPGATPADGHWYKRHIVGARVAVAARASQLALATHWSRILHHVAP